MRKLQPIRSFLGMRTLLSYAQVWRKLQLFPDPSVFYLKILKILIFILNESFSEV